MEIIVGKTAGFCYGVKRAVEETEKIAKDDKNIYCLGELVHNRQVINKLEKLGVNFIEDIDEANGETIIRTHGIAKETYEEANKRNIKIKDLTCPNVLKIHKIVEKYSNDGYYIFLTGSKSHPENIGTLSYCGKNYSVIEDIQDTYVALEQLKKSKVKKLLLISQTTYDLEKFYLIREIISYNLESNIHFEIENTICEATQKRQEETEKISKEADCMVIIGGKNSANTKKLYEISLKNCRNVIWTEKDINKDEIKKFDKIGIMAGASTPQESIDSVINQIK